MNSSRMSSCSSSATNESNDTICAVSTPPGIGGIAVIRISGPDSIPIVDSIWRGKSLCKQSSHSAHLGYIADPEATSGEILDQGVATIFRSPASFTGEDVVELSVHGSVFIQQQLVQLLIRRGCRMALPGEFTRRAFAAGKLDLAEAEAVADVIASTTKAAHRMAMNQMRGQFSSRLHELREKLLELAALMELELDFSEEEVEFADRTKLRDISQAALNEINRLTDSFATGNAILNGVPVAIVGRPNAGKSSLLNSLVNDNRAIVSDIPGTTRDTIEDTIVIEDVTFRFIDTAGLRHTSDSIENLGIEKAWQKISQASVILWVTEPTDTTETLAETLENILQKKQPSSTLLQLRNKCDTLTAMPPTSDAYEHFSDILTDKPDAPSNPTPRQPHATINISAKTGYGINELKHALILASTGNVSSDDVIISNIRHYEALTSAARNLHEVVLALSPTHYPPVPTDLIAQDLRASLHHLSTITGSITTPDILTTIFSRFCVGK